MIYDPYKDSPNKIISEGRQIDITFEKISSTSADICWTLPTNLENSNSPPSEYNGVVIVLDTIPIIDKQSPIDGKFYVADYTADADLHLGDKIDTGLVVGAFYDNKTTKSITIQGINPTVSYYVAGFAVDNVTRYHTEGVRSYSIALKLNKVGTDTSGYNIVKLGVQDIASTGLAPTNNYTLLTTIDGNPYTWNFIGSTIPTYQDLVDSVNFKIATIDSPYIGAIPQNTNGLYVDLPNTKVYQWDGFHNNLIPTYFNNVAPNIVNINEYWSDANNILRQWDGINWNVLNTFNFPRAINRLDCDDYWFNGTIAYSWNKTIWVPTQTYITDIDPTTKPTMTCSSYWFNTITHVLSSWEVLTDCNLLTNLGKWNKTNALLSNVNPVTLADGSYWFNSLHHTLNKRIGGVWHTYSIPKLLTDPPVYIQNIQPIAPGLGSLWYNGELEVLYEYNSIGAIWAPIDVVTWNTDPTIVVSGELWWNTTTDLLYVWDVIINNWTQVVNFSISTTDPSLPAHIITGSTWYQPATTILQHWDGTQWCLATYFYSLTTPGVSVNDYWFNTASNLYYQWDGLIWNNISVQSSINNPLTPTIGDYWYSLSSNTLSTWTGVAWMPVMFSNTSLIPAVDTLWYNSITHILSKWNGSSWIAGGIRAIASLDPNGDFIITSTSKGSSSSVYIASYADAAGTIPGLFNYTVPVGQYQPMVKGTDSIPTVPMYNQLGVGTDGSADERKNLIKQILMALGYPSIKVELSKDQLNYAVDLALSMFRRNSGSAYERAIFFMDLMPNQQHYYLTDRTAGLHRIVKVQSMHRKSSSFLGNASGQGVYGQAVLQHLYSMGSYDLVSYHIISEYVELMEILFASRIVQRFNERTRRLDIFQSIGYQERVLVDCTLERTEQELISDRIAGKWIKDWALGESCQMLAQVRGKFSSLPGAGGGVSLNASDLQARADALFTQCYADIDDYIANEPENTGLESTIVIG